MDIWGTSILAFPRVLLFNIRESHDEVSVHYTSGSYLLIESAWGFYQESNIIIIYLNIVFCSSFCSYKYIYIPQDSRL